MPLALKSNGTRLAQGVELGRQEGEVLGSLFFLQGYQQGQQSR